MASFRTVFTIIFLVSSSVAIGQTIPEDKVISTNNLVDYLTPEVKASLSKNGTITEATLAHYFREKFTERYFYNWQDFDSRFKEYNMLYAGADVYHAENANDHMGKYEGNTNWKLPFNYLNNHPVNAYALRHLARQHKMVDVAFEYYYQGKNPEYIHYFTEQMQSLNHALTTNNYEKIEDGNGVYEVFRSGYRILNWLQIHNMFLDQEAYSDKDQLTTIATLLQHGAHLYKNNPEFTSGNHQTRGMSALAMISILFRDFKDTNSWNQRAMSLLEQHMAKEINDDGFQFERTVHYHLSDIDNYFYVYQLAKISNLEVSPFWEERLKSLFITLIKIAYPDKSAPVLSDDTDNPWGEKNDISGAMTLGYLLFELPEVAYFANNQVERKMFWYVTNEQLQLLDNIKVEEPTLKSSELPITGYYIMREGWKKDDKMMIITAGLDKDKPDHQHGDMLGIQAMANGKVILPNYQVRYSLEDYGFFKNSMVKNVALVDDELQGKQYTSNQGGSGFGKFLELPQPKTIAWSTNSNLDLFVGSHDGFTQSGVNYSRQVIYLKDDFWIIKDNFSSDKIHEYKQIWQGHYSLEDAPNLLRSTFEDASGFDIYQVKKTDAITNSGKRGKQWAIVSKKGTNNFSFITVLFPYKGFDNRIDEVLEKPSFKGWLLNNTLWKVSGNEPTTLSKDNKIVCFSANKIETADFTCQVSAASDVVVSQTTNIVQIQSIGENETSLTFFAKETKKTVILKPGETVEFTVK